MQNQESIDMDLFRYWLAIRRRWLPALAVFSGTVAFVTLASILLKPSYQAEGKLLFKIDRSSLLTGLTPTDEPTKLTPLVATQNPVSTQLEILNSKPILQKVINSLNLKGSDGEPLDPKTLQKKLKIKIVGGTDVASITYKSKDPQESADVINQLMNFYIDSDIVTGRSEAASASEFISKQLPKVAAAVQESELALRQFKEKYRVLDLVEESRSAVGELSRLDTEINSAHSALAELDSSTAVLQKQIGLDSKAMATVMNLGQSPAVQGIIQDIQTVERQLANDRGVYTANSPIIEDSEEKLNELRNLLQKTIGKLLSNQFSVSTELLQPGTNKQQMIQSFLASEVQRAGIERRLKTLYATKAAYQARAGIIPELEERQRDLTRRLEAAQSTYQVLLKRQRDLQVQENENVSIARVIDPATVPEEGQARTPILLALGTLLGLFLGASTILWLELRDRSIKTLSEVREIYPYPLLGIIPIFSPPKALSKRARHQQDSKPQVPVRDFPRSLVSEMYRLLQANLKFLRSDNPVRMIAVTSAVPREGKSSVSANLAMTMAQLKRKVLLIDADMHLPSQHHAWNLTNQVGLSEVLVGQTDFESACCSVTENLDVLPAGTIPPNPLALLDSKRMTSLLKSFSQVYDYIIIDTPPLTVAADALTLGQLTDGILLVSRPGIIDSSASKSALELLECSGQQVLGLVVNGIDQSSDPTAHFYHSQAYFTNQGTVNADKRHLLPQK
jgi:capsular exopolysaccharide synthesis family protein